MRRHRLLDLSLASTVVALLVFSAQAGAAKPQPNKVRTTPQPILALAMDGPRAAYMRSDRRVEVWNVMTGATSVVKGNYPSNGHNFGHGSGEVAIAGTRVALITRFVIGNTDQTQERLYTASLGGSAHQLGKVTNHSSDGGDCTVPGSGFADGDWIAGVVGAGKVLAVSSWKSNDSGMSDERLSLVTPTSLRTIATGPGAIVAESASDGHLAVLRSTAAWPAPDGGPPVTTTPTVGIYSAGGALLDEIALSIPTPGPCGYPDTIVRVALSGDRLVVLTATMPQAGSLTSTLDVYDSKTGALIHSLPVALNHSSPSVDRLAVYGPLAAIEGPYKLLLVDLTTGKAVTVGPASGIGCPAAINPRGLVYAVNAFGRHPHGKLVFVPMAKLVAAVS